MKKLKILEGISAISLLISKILLFFGEILGWPFSIFGYALVAFYNFVRKDALLGSTVVGLAAIKAPNSVFASSNQFKHWIYTDF